MRELVIVQLNDLHGYLNPHPEWFLTPQGFSYRETGGLARIKTVVDNLRARHGDILLCDNGDTFHGTRAVVDSQGSCLVPILNKMGFAAMTGHWDFAYGPEVLQKLVQQLDYPFLAANVYNCSDGELVFPPCRKYSVGAICVGIIGLACNIVDKTMPAHFSKGIRFTDGTNELPRYIKQMREKENVDVVVLLSHLGLPQDIDLLERRPGVDICLSSHTHNRLSAPLKIGNTLLIQSGCHGSFLGKLHIGLGLDRIELIEHELITIEADVTEDRDVQELVEKALGSTATDGAIICGYTPVALNRATMLESTADNLLLDAMLAASGAELAFANGWRYGAPIPVGEVTLDSLYNLAPMNPEIMLVDLTGAELSQMIEENLERTLSRQPFGQMGGYVKRCAGMQTYFKVENPKGTRVQAIYVGDSLLESERSYLAAYITMQAVPDKYGKNRSKSGITLIDAVKRLMQASPNPALRNSFIEV